MYIIVSAAHPRHCQPACILPVSKLPGTWREKLRAITEPPLRGGVWSPNTAVRFSLHGDSALTSGMLLTPFNVHFQIQNVSFHIGNCFQWSAGRLLSQKENTQRSLAVSSFFFFPSFSTRKKLKPFDLEVQNKESYFIRSENYMTAVRKGSKLSLLIFS